jgi:hypothetical protein
MFPPYHERQDELELVSNGLEPLIWPLPWRYEYIPFGEPVPLWQFTQLPGVPLAR